MNFMNADLPGVESDYSTHTLLQLLNNSTSFFFPVYSAFNGISIVKYAYTIDCMFIGQNLELIDFDSRRFEFNRYDDCEHVSFYKMMINIHHARVMIYKYAL